MTTEPYTATICGRERTVRGWDKKGKVLLLNHGERYVFTPLADPKGGRKAVFHSRRLLAVAKLTYTGEGWLLNEETRTLAQWLSMEEQSVMDRRGIPPSRRGGVVFMKVMLRENIDDDRTRYHPEFSKRLFLNGALDDLTAARAQDACAVAWFARDHGNRGVDEPMILCDFRRVEDESMATVAREIADERQRLEAVTGQLADRNAALAETIAPLTKLYSEVELAEIRKRAVGKGVPDFFVDWALSTFQASCPTKLPTKGDAFDHCGPDTIVGGKLKSAGHGTSIQTFARWLAELRRVLENKGWLQRPAPGKGRRRADGVSAEDSEDMNQPTPAEAAADRDDEEARTPIGEDTDPENTRDEE